MGYLLGIDIGTTNIKLGVFSEDLKPLETLSVRTPISVEEPLGEVIRVRDLKDALKSLFSKIPEEYRRDVSGIGISSLGETVFPVGEEPVLSGMIWYNSRTQEVFKRFIDKIGFETLFRKTAIPPSWVFSLFKLLYAYEKFPELLENIKWLDVSSFIAYLLTGDIGMDKSLSSRTMMVNIETGKWDDEVLKISGIPKGHLPPIKPCGEFRGVTTEKTSEEFGIPSGVVVTTAGQDHITASFAAGVFSKEVVLNSSGTTEVILWGVKLDTIERYMESGPGIFQAGFHTLDGFYYLLSGLPTGGFSIEWFVRNVLKRDFDIFRDFKHRENTVFFFPFLRKAFAGEKIGAAFYGLKDTDGADEMLSAVMEGLAFELRIMVEGLKKLGLEEFEVVAVGGGIRLREFSKIKASVLKVPVEVFITTEATSLGSAMMAGYASGIFKSPLEAVEVGKRFSEEITPENEEYFEEKYHDYLELKEKLY